MEIHYLPSYQINEKVHAPDRLGTLVDAASKHSRPLLYRVYTDVCVEQLSYSFAVLLAYSKPSRASGHILQVCVAVDVRTVSFFDKRLLIKTQGH